MKVLEEEKGRVKLHYVGYGHEYDEWRDAEEVEETETASSSSTALQLSGQLVQEVAEGTNPYRTVYRNNRPRHKGERECMTTTTLDLLRQEVFVGRPAARLVSPRRCQTNRTKHQKQRENDYVCPHLENPDRQIQFSSQNHKKGIVGILARCGIRN